MAHFHLSCGRADVSARIYEATRDPLAWLILAPGAGAGHEHPFMVAMAQGFAARGLATVTFNFPYIERGRRGPDPAAVLEACWVAALQAVRAKAGDGAKLFAGGKSMGGRIASQVAARAGEAAAAGENDPAGLVFLGYPLHPPGRPQQQRTAHWPAIRVPAIFVQGTRDPFASPEELREALPRFGGATTLRLVEDGDHSFKVPRRSGTTGAAVYDRVQEWVVEWVAACVSAS